LLSSILVLVFLLPASCSAAGQANPNPVPVGVNSSLLMNDSLYYDGREVVYFGEVVGVMKRGPHAWVNIQDDTYSIGVYLPVELVNDTLMAGSYSSKGDMVEVTGVFNRACPEHGGDADIHASKIRVVARGYPVEHPVSLSEIFLTISLLAANIPLLILLRRIQHAP
jgi:hypothetical protein